jgi:hypothetical protein
MRAMTSSSDRDPGAAAAQPPDHVEAVHVGQHHVEHDQVRPVPLRGLHRLGAGGRGDHLEAGVTEARREELEDVRLVFDD